jgi:hypothetical protein
MAIGDKKAERKRIKTIKPDPPSVPVRERKTDDELWQEFVEAQADKADAKGVVISEGALKRQRMVANVKIKMFLMAVLAMLSVVMITGAGDKWPYVLFMEVVMSLVIVRMKF